jgi:hypothetical protein
MDEVLFYSVNNKRELYQKQFEELYSNYTNGVVLTVVCIFLLVLVVVYRYRMRRRIVHRPRGFSYV